MLSNAYVLEKFRFYMFLYSRERARQKFANFANFATLVEPRVLDGGPRRALEALAPALGLLRRHVPALLRGPRVVPNSWQILGKILLVFYCIDANLRK